MPKRQTSIKQKVLRMVERLPEDVTYDRVLNSVTAMRNIEEAEQQFARGQWIDHDDLFDELINPKNAKNPVVNTGEPGSQGNSGVHRKTRSKNSRKISPASAVRRAKAKEVS